MLAKVRSAATVGLQAVPVTVEVDIAAQSLPSFTIVGLPSKSVEESKERVRAAIKNSGAEFPQHRIIVNLAPADLPKEGPAYDLPIALGILLASGQLAFDTTDILFFGELSLDGQVQHTHGVLPFVLLAKEKKYKAVFLPAVDAQEAAIVADAVMYPVSSLFTLFRHCAGTHPLSTIAHVPFQAMQSDGMSEFDLADIVGQEQGKRALEIAAAGGHNIHFTGVPGAGKTMLARALPGILPHLTESEALEVTKIYSITGNLSAGSSIVTKRSFRSPHHTTSRNGLIGGGTRPMPGEISLAHRGVLFLDEFPEFPRHVLEALRQPIEDGMVTISRAAGTVTYPAKFILLAASNPCPCGYFGDERKKCRCATGQILQYKKRLSGPIMERIDLHVTIPPVPSEMLVKGKKSASSRSVQKRVQKARDKQSKRYNGTKFLCNVDVSSKYVKEQMKLHGNSEKFLQHAITRLHLSARSYYRVMKVARTIADLEEEHNIVLSHLAEALQYRELLQQEV